MLKLKEKSMPSPLNIYVHLFVSEYLDLLDNVDQKAYDDLEENFIKHILDLYDPDLTADKLAAPEIPTTSQ